MKRLKSIRIENFKSLEDKKFNLSERTEIYGPNAVGKTSVGEAIRFALFPSKGDKDKIAIGKERAKVFLELEETLENGEKVPLTVDTSIDESTEPRRKVLFDGITPSQPAKFLRDMLSFGTFNPREMVRKEGRKERLLKMIPFKAKEEDFKDFPILERQLLNWDEHAFETLAKIDRDLRNTKLNLYQKKELLKKHYEKYEADLSAKELAYKQNFPVELKESYERVLTSSGEMKAEIESCEERISDQKVLLKDSRFDIVSAKEKIARLEAELASTKETLKLNEQSVVKYEAKISRDEKTLKEMQERLAGMGKMKLQASEKKSIEALSEDLAKHKAEAKQAVEDHDIHYKWISVEFPRVRNKIIAPLREKIPGLDISELGKMTIDGKSIDELSDSETLALGIKFLSVENKSSFIVVDCAETMTRETIEGTEWPENVVLLRVAGEPLGGDWKSIKIL